MTEDNFKWTDELVMEIIGLTHRAGYHKEPAKVYDRVIQFKQSKLQSQDKPQPSSIDRIVELEKELLQIKGELYAKTNKKYSESEVDTIREETWKAARETTFSFKGEQYFPNPKIKYPTLQDYLNSLSKETKPKEEGKPVEGYLNTVEAYSEGFTHGVRHCQKYGIPL
jgi:hypothetical protein